jgi:hypothetical protein
MTNPSKIKGSKWERDAIKQLSKNAEYAKRTPGSGAIGTVLHESRLTGDGTLRYKFLPTHIKTEMKYGYGGNTQMSVKRLWMEKVREECKADNSIPAVLIKFRDVTHGDIESAKWICFTLEDWDRIVMHLNELFSDMEEFWEQKYGKSIPSTDNTKIYSSNTK